MDHVDLLYSVLICATVAMLSLCTGMLLAAAFLALVPSRKDELRGRARTGFTRSASVRSKLVARSS